MVEENKRPATVIYNTVSLLILAVGLFCFGSVVILLLFFSTSRYPYSVENYVSNTKLLIPIFIFLALFLVYIRRCTKDSRSNVIDKAVIISLPVIFIWQIYVFLHIFFESGWDAGLTATVARAIAYGDKDTLFLHSSGYLSRCQNNLFLTLISGKLLALSNAIGILPKDYELMAIVIANSAISLLSAFLVYNILRILVRDSRLSLMGYILVIILCTLSPWNVITYSDPLSLAFPALVLYLYIKPELNTKVRWLLIAAFGFLGYMIKPTVAIIFIAIFGINIIDFACSSIKGKAISGKEFVNKISTVAYALSVIVLLNAFIAHQYNVTGYTIDNTQKYSMYHFLMMGQNDPTNGGYLWKDVEFSNSFKDYETRKAATKKVIKERIRNRGTLGQIDFTARKVLSDFNDGTFAWAVEGNFYYLIKPELTKASPFFRSIYYSDGKNYKVFKITTQFCWWLTILLVFVSVVYEFVQVLRKKRVSKIYLIIISTLIGISMYDAIFETRARYLYIYVPIFVVCAIYGMTAILESLLSITGSKLEFEDGRYFP